MSLFRAARCAHSDWLSVIWTVDTPIHTRAEKRMMKLHCKKTHHGVEVKDEAVAEHGGQITAAHDQQVVKGVAVGLQLRNKNKVYVSVL